MPKNKTIVTLIRKENNKYYLKFPFIQQPVAMNQSVYKSILNSDDYSVVNTIQDRSIPLSTIESEQSH